jgi:hypothetical protein
LHRCFDQWCDSEQLHHSGRRWRSTNLPIGRSRAPRWDPAEVASQLFHSASACSAVKLSTAGCHHQVPPEDGSSASDSGVSSTSAASPYEAPRQRENTVAEPIEFPARRAHGSVAQETVRSCATNECFDQTGAVPPGPQDLPAAVWPRHPAGRFRIAPVSSPVRRRAASSTRGRSCSRRCPRPRRRTGPHAAHRCYGGRRRNPSCSRPGARRSAAMPLPTRDQPVDVRGDLVSCRGCFADPPDVVALAGGYRVVCAGDRRLQPSRSRAGLRPTVA